MGIPESQLETWSHQGSITQSSETYGIIKRTLENDKAPYNGKNYKIFLQGSYGNDTNIYTESDVDVIIQLDDVYYSDTSDLSPEDKEAYDLAFIPATYSYDEYKKDVRNVLEDKFGKDVSVGSKALTIAANGNRRKADVIAAMQYRRYSSFKNSHTTNFEEGICFFNDENKIIANYPKQHSSNLTLKHQDTNKWLKPMIRIIKNLRSKLVSDGLLKPGIAPSYFLEGLLYNIPSAKFGSSYGDCFVNAINWIQQEADKSKLVCANEQYYLLWNNSPTSWEKADAEAFLTAATKLWNDW
ncbi:MULTISPECIES: nucleotidyltransferase [Pseudomonas]|uniref:Nucleotidyltransferase n=1 Tax=Pseudomonas aphyarum TaxID=2942629 RepID=A0ABT5PKH8_9PSED|nr:nucleotidyltransferase [Pseudomonas aphyarum]MDD0968502.1 nucleotidyltransferase [Pseudomonas aphyarum]MDD1124402.1 nucleotidyltransferase [Pseudomonas aphyarum]